MTNRQKLSHAWRGAPWVAPERFSELELQISSLCNRSCSFCPSGNFPVPRAFMTMETVERIVSAVEPIGFSGTVGFHLMCEPLLNKRFPEILAIFRARLPGTYLRIETNGDPIRDFGKLAEYFDAGLNEILINCYDSVEQFEERNGKLLELERRVPDIWYANRHLGMPGKGPKSHWKVVRLRDFHRDDLELRNWGGHIDSQHSTVPVLPLEQPCERPFQRLHINYLGEVVLCNNDWKHEVVFGNFNESSLDEILNSPLRRACCERLARSDRNQHLCRTCDYWFPIDAPPEPPVGLAAKIRHPAVVARKRWRRGIKKSVMALGRTWRGLTGTDRDRTRDELR